jgi:predicted MFS family arabinose efflux permease
MRLLSGAASAGLIPVCLAYIGDATSYADRQVVLSRFLVGVVIAQTIAGPVGGLFGQFLSWRGVFLLLAVAAFSLAVLVLGQLRRLPAPPRVAHTPRNYAGLWAPGPRLLLFLTMIDGIVFTGTVPFIAPFLHERLGLAYGEAGLVLSCFGLGCWGYIKLAPKLVAGLEERQIALAGGLMAAAGMALAALAWLWPAYIAVEIMLGLGYFMLHSVLQARATEMLPNARGTAVSGFAFALFLGQAVGALLCAAGIAEWGYRTVFAVDCPALLALSLALWVHLRPRTGCGRRRGEYETKQA